MLQEIRTFTNSKAGMEARYSDDTTNILPWARDKILHHVITV